VAKGIQMFFQRNYPYQETSQRPGSKGSQRL
jgi:hypothetical protein